MLFRIKDRKTMTGDNVLCKNLYLLEKKKYDLGTFWAFLFKNSDEHSRPTFDMGVSLRG